MSSFNVMDAAAGRDPWSDAPCPKTWETREWDTDLGVPYQRTHECVLAPHATGNHRDAAGNVRVRFEE